MRSCIELQPAAMKHGMENALVIVGPRPGEHTIRTEDVIAKIEEAGDSLATVMMPGINYLTGQVVCRFTIDYNKLLLFSCQKSRKIIPIALNGRL